MCHVYPVGEAVDLAEVGGQAEIGRHGRDADLPRRVQIDHAETPSSSSGLGVGDERLVSGVQEADPSRGCSAGFARRMRFMRRRAAAAARRARASSARTSPSRGTPRSRRAPPVLAGLVAGVDPIGGRERRGQHERASNAGRPPSEGTVQDVGRVHEEVRPDSTRASTWPARSTYSVSSAAVFFHVKYV